MLNDYNNLSDKEKRAADNIERAMLEMDPSVTQLIIHNTIILSRLMDVLDYRSGIRDYDRKYINQKLSKEEWAEAEEHYDPTSELFSMFGYGNLGKSDEQDK